jgi:nicotinate-nucleotide pyrophosphorylase (carboxylating)
LILSGKLPFLEVLRQTDPKIKCQFLAAEGNHIVAPETIAEIEGPAGSILTAERTALNFLMHLSGIATQTHRFVEAIGLDGPKLLDTRKTTPGLRLLEKEAVRHGGGQNHRLALFDGILLKDNHIQAIGSITEAVKLAKKTGPHNLKIEVEVENIEQLQEALSAGADILLLDNMTISELKKAVYAATQFFSPAERSVLLEASGGITLKNISEVATTGVDFISVGALTHSAPAADLGLDWLE